VISGINLGRWGRDLNPGVGQTLLSAAFDVDFDFGDPTDSDSKAADKSVRPTLPVLVRAILDETSIEKLRISSVEPMDWSAELIRIMAGSPRIAKHAHVPLQSGSDAVLRRMHRKYRPWHYREKITKIRKAMPNAAIGADVMVGFPGETEAEFAETRRMIEELPFTYLHVFTYSARPGTLAAEHANQVPVGVAKDRNQVLRDIATTKRARFMQAQVGMVLELITLRTGDEDFTEALTDNYLKIKIPGRWQANQWMAVEAVRVEDGGNSLIGAQPENGQVLDDSFGAPEMVTQPILMEPLGK